MKKLLTSVIAAAALLLGFASCSGDLHDIEVPKHEPVTIEGASWYYYDVTVYGDNDGATGKIILNNGSDKSKSTDTLLPEFTAAAGGALYFTADKSKLTDGKYELLSSYQNDNPSYTAVPGTVRIYIYTNESSCCVYIWDNKNAFASAAWPGNVMTKSGEIAEETYDAKAILNSITITGLPAELNGKTVYLTGSPLGWNKPGTGKSIETVINDGKISLKDLAIDLSAKGIVVGKVGKVEMKFAAVGWSKPEITADGGNDFKISVDGETINLVGVYRGTKGTEGDDANVFCCLFAQ